MHACMLCVRVMCIIAREFVRHADCVVSLQVSCFSDNFHILLSPNRPRGNVTFFLT